MLCALADRLKAEYGMETVRVEYGPGLYFPYFSHEDHSDTLAPIRELAPDLAALAAHCELTIEMGRFFASECGAYLTRVVDTKVNGGTAYAIVDGGIHHVNYLGGNMGMRVPIIEQSPAREGDMQPWALCGSLCTTADVLVREAQLPPLRVGDVIALGRCGAYSVTEGVAVFLSRDMPRVALCRGGNFTLVRDRFATDALNTCRTPEDEA